MNSAVAVLGLSGGYLALLFAVAYWADRRRERGRSWIANPYVYSLSLAVYCTAWTFYGSVGRASETGLGFLPVYLGPTLIALTWWFLLRKIIRVAKQNNLTSIADFISARYGNSTALGVLVSLSIVVGIMPYTALQLKAVASTFEILERGLDPSASVSLRTLGIDTAFVVALVMSAFGIMFGARHLSPSERHEGMVAAVAFESGVKLVAFVSVGLFVTFGVFGGPAEIFGAAAEVPAYRELFVLNGTESPSFVGWLSITILSAMAVMFLPRQFHVAVVENVSEEHVRKAMWLFPLYLLGINVLVLPIAFAGLLTFGQRPLEGDFFVITLPLQFGQPGLAVFAFVGGLSAATAMLVVESVAVSTVILNNLVAPLVLKLGLRGDLSSLLLNGRRIGIVAVIMLGYLYYRAVGETNSLVNLGLVSFAAAFQFAPLIICGLYLKWVSRRGALLGLGAGLVVWSYTLVVPTLVASGWLPRSIVDDGLFGLAALRPSSLFGMDELDAWTHILFWSVLLNLGGLLLGSVFMRPEPSERVQADKFVDCFREAPADPGRPAVAGNLVGDLESLVSRFVGAQKASELMRRLSEASSRGERPAWIQQAEIVGAVERELAGALGPVAARFIIESHVRQRRPQLETIIDAFGEVSLSLEQNREDLGRRVRELSIVQEASHRISASLSLPEIGDAVSRLLTRELSVDRVAVLTLDTDGRLHPPSDVAGASGIAESAAIQRVLAERRTAMTPGDPSVPGLMRSYLAVPIGSGEAMLGVLVAYSAADLVYFSPDLVRLVQVIANQLGAALRNARLYEELRLLSLDLDQKVRDRTAELERANQQLQEIDQRKSEFLSVVAHELRTPLTSICSFSEILLAYDPIEPGRMREFVGVIHEEGERLTRLIGQVLDISRIESGRLELHLEEERLADILRAAYTVTRPHADRRRVTIDVILEPHLPPITADRDRLIQVVTNLLTNAVRVSPPDGVVTLCASRINGSLEVSVGDAGPGVPGSQRERIFEKFAQIDDPARAGLDGTGLGLFVARQIVELHEGRIWVDRSASGGADFRFTLPIGDENVTVGRLPSTLAAGTITSADNVKNEKRDFTILS
jgi:Na+/proline symporter/signal transduction histidine kinase